MKFTGMRVFMCVCEKVMDGYEWNVQHRKLVSCLTALSAQTGYIVPKEYEIYYVEWGTKQTYHKK